MLTKKDSQKKYFTLIFSESTNTKYIHEPVKVPAKKGKSLIDVVQPIFENHGMSFESHSLFIGSSNTPLPLNGDTFHYGGNTLYVRENKNIDIDKRILSLMKNDGKRLSIDINKQFFVLLDQNETVESTSSNLNELKDEAGDEFALEACWKDIITEDTNMLYRRKVQQEAIWELFTTEISFIKDIKVIIDVFQKRFKILQDGGYLTEVNDKLIFANIQEIYFVNMTFWRGLKEIIKNARYTKQPICPSHLVVPFQGFEHLFQPYIQFCNANTSNVILPDYSPSTNEMIKQYFSWCDNHEQCKRITMAGFLIKPLQRVTKYSLLLKAIVNKTDNEIEKSIAEELMSKVEIFVSTINNAVHLRQEEEKLNNVIIRLSDYCPVEPVNEEVEKLINEYCNLNFKGRIPGLPENEKRFILKEGAMKLVEKQGKKEVYAFLFSDVFVITKLKRNIDKYRITRPPYRLNKIFLRDLKDPGQLLFVHLNEYGVVSNAFVLQVDVSEQKKWRLALEKAKENYELIRKEFGFQQGFWDDDISNTSSIIKNNVQRKHVANIDKNPPLFILPSLNSRQIEEFTYEWDNTMTMVVLGLFIAINVVMSSFLGH